VKLEPLGLAGHTNSKQKATIETENFLRFQLRPSLWDGLG
jgi:hypothetical protein